MHPLAVGAAAAATIRIQAGVVALRFGLSRLAVHDDVVHLHVVVGAVVEILHRDPAAQRAGGGVVLVRRTQCPGLHRRVVHAQPDLLAAPGAASANGEALAASTSATARAR